MNFLHKLLETNKIKRWALFLTSFILGLMLFLGCASLSQIQFLVSPVPVFPSAIQPMDNLGNLIRELKRTMPRPNSEGFVIPSKSDEQAFQAMANAIENNNPDFVNKTAPTYNYELLMLPDQKDLGANSFILHEQIPIKKGWGLYAFRSASPQNIVIEAPHPMTDEYTEEVALDLYRALHAKALLIAGTVRNANADNSSDMAHTTESIFQAIHVALFNLGGHPNQDTIFLQIHGYATQGHSSYPQVVISFNWKNDPEKDMLLNKIIQALHDNNLSTGICDGTNYRDICGTTNIQRSVTIGGIFIHLELAESLREQDAQLVRALQQAIQP